MPRKKNGLLFKLDHTMLYCLVAAMIAFVINSEVNARTSSSQISQLKRRVNSQDSELRDIKEVLYEIRGDVRFITRTMSM